MNCSLLANRDTNICSGYGLLCVETNQCICDKGWAGEGEIIVYTYAYLYTFLVAMIICHLYVMRVSRGGKG